MSILVRRTGSSWSWILIALLIAVVVTALATSYFGLAP